MSMVKKSEHLIEETKSKIGDQKVVKGEFKTETEEFLFRASSYLQYENVNLRQVLDDVGQKKDAEYWEKIISDLRTNIKGLEADFLERAEISNEEIKRLKSQVARLTTEIGNLKRCNDEKEMNCHSTGAKNC